MRKGQRLVLFAGLWRSHVKRTLKREDAMMTTASGRPVLMALAGAATLGLGAVAMAGQVQHIRGTIQSVHGHTLTIESYSGGKTTKVTLNSGTKYAWLVPSSLSKIKPGDFIGTAALGPKTKMTAQEVVIFPKSMRGAGEGHYPWQMPAAVAQHDAKAGGAGNGGASNGGPPVKGTMTNGTIVQTGQSSGGAPPVKGSMTNGNVASTGSSGGGKTLTISYNNGHKVQVTVPKGAPVVRFQPASKSVVKHGRKAFIVAGTGAGHTAEFVAVGKNGLMPPM